MTEIKGILCPKCKSFVSSYVSICPNCGLKNPDKVKSFHAFRKLELLNFIKIFIGANSGFFLLSILLTTKFGGSMGSMFTPNLQILRILGMASPELYSAHGLWVLISAMFLHGSVLHILFNMYALFILAPTLVRLLNPKKMVLIYVFTGIVGNIVALMWWESVVGASGAVFGIIGAIIAHGRKRNDALGYHLVRQLVPLVIINLVIGFAVPIISNSAHIGGFLSGLLLGYFIPIFDSPSSKSIVNLLFYGCLGLLTYTWLMMILSVLPLIFR